MQQASTEDIIAMLMRTLEQIEAEPEAAVLVVVTDPENEALLIGSSMSLKLEIAALHTMVSHVRSRVARAARDMDAREHPLTKVLSRGLDDMERVAIDLLDEIGVRSVPPAGAFLS